MFLFYMIISQNPQDVGEKYRKLQEVNPPVVGTRSLPSFYNLASINSQKDIYCCKLVLYKNNKVLLNLYFMYYLHIELDFIRWF